MQKLGCCIRSCKRAARLRHARTCGFELLLGSTASEISAKLARELSLPSGYFFNVGGRVESQCRAVRSLGIASSVAILGVFLLLYLALGSAAEAMVILALPIGGIAALLIARETS